MTRLNASALPEYLGNPFIERLPPTASNKEAYQALRMPPIYSEAERFLPAEQRFDCIRRLLDFFEPLSMHLALNREIGALIRRGYISRNPNSSEHYQRLREGNLRITKGFSGLPASNVLGAAGGFALLGCSGIGKTSTMTRILSQYPQLITHKEPVRLEQIVWLKIECPLNGSIKQLCLSFFLEVDRVLAFNGVVDSKYAEKYGGTRNSAESMMAWVAQIANLHGLGILVIDEIQNLLEGKGKGRGEIMNFLVTLINSIGLPVVSIGTLAATPLFQENFRQARRASGMGGDTWDRFEQGEEWDFFVNSLWKYQWTNELSPLTLDIRAALYDESQGIVDVLLKLIMHVQTAAIDNGSFKGAPEAIDAKLIRRTAAQKFVHMQKMLDALRKNDSRELAQYNDLRARDKVEVQSAFTAQSNKDPATILRLFQESGGNLDDLQAMLNGDSETAPKSLQKAPRTNAKKATRPAADSLIALVVAGKMQGTTPHAALKEAKVIGVFD